MVNRKSLIQRLTMPLPELEAYYREQRAERFRNNEPVHGIEWRKYHYANVGENISPAGYDLEHKHVLTDKLRDALCTLKWEIWEQFSLVSRDLLPSDAVQQLVDGIMSQTNHGYTPEVINRARYHSNTETKPQEVFAHLDTLIPRRENAFLLRER